MCPASAMHGPHHVAQKSTRTSLPLSVSLLTVSPFVALNEYCGVSPTFTAPRAGMARTGRSATNTTTAYMGERFMMDPLRKCVGSDAQSIVPDPESVKENYALFGTPTSPSPL